MALWGKTDQVADRPSWIDLANYPEGTELVFIDASEAEVESNKAKGFTGAGWYLYREYLDAQENTRHKVECLVAMGVSVDVAGDDNDDTVVPDLYFAIDSQPQDASALEGDTASFSVVMDTNAVAGDITYQWQKSDDGGETWYDIVGALSNSYETGALTVADDNGDKYRVTAKLGDKSVTSNEVTLTVTD